MLSVTKPEDGITHSKVRAFNRFCRYHLKWDVSISKVRSVLHGRQQVLSMGTIPVADADFNDTTAEDFMKSLILRKEQEKKPDRKAEREAQKALRQERKPNRKAERKAQRALRQEEAEKRRKIYLDLVDDNAEPDPFKQDTDSHVRLQLYQNRNLKSYVKIQHFFHYIDASTSDTQPSYNASVYLTQNNAREHGSVDSKSEPDKYVESHRIFDVSSETWQPALAALFPHVDEVYLTGLRRSGHRVNPLLLLCFEHNELPYTSNVFTHHTGNPELSKQLALVMRASPRVFILVRASDIHEPLQAIVDDWMRLVIRDPKHRFFNDPRQQYINDESVKPIEKCPRFTAPAQYVFETFEDFERHVGLCSIFEQRWRNNKKAYTGKAAIIPVVDSYKKGRELFNVYNVNFELDEACKRLPALTKNDIVVVHIDVDMYGTSDSFWTGKVSASTPATSPGQISIFVHRPYEKGIPVDTKEYSSLTPEQVDRMNEKQLRAWTRGNCNVKVKIFSKNDASELKRLACSMEAMRIPKKLIPEHKAAHKRLQCYQRLLTGTDFPSLPSSDLWAQVKPSIRDQGIVAATAGLYEHQLSVIEAWHQGRIHAETAMLVGVSGGGKTKAWMRATLLYLLELRVPLGQPKKHVADQRKFLLAIQTRKDADQRDDDSWGESAQDPGRITICAMQNDTVDDLFARYLDEADKFAEAMGVSRFLGLRVHSPKTEVGAVLAMIRPDFGAINHEDRRLRASGISTGTTSKVLQKTCLKTFEGSQFQRIHDRRFDLIDDSVAFYICQIAGIEGYPVSDRIINAFTAQELEIMHGQLSDLREVHSELVMSANDMTEDLERKATNSARLGFRFLISRASFVVTTMATATRRSFNIFRQAHVVVLEEAGRANEAETVALFSHYCDVLLRMFVGDDRQLGPFMFGPQEENNFFAQGLVSFLKRARECGFYAPDLKVTSRFVNDTMLELCRIGNKDKSIVNNPESYDEDLTREARETMYHVWKKDTVLVFIDVHKAPISTSATGSICCLDGAKTIMHSIIRRLEVQPGKRVSWLTPYTHECQLALTLIDKAIEIALAWNNEPLADRLRDVVVSTVDSYMGKDNDHVYLDFANNLGFIKGLPRTLVALTRARVSMEIYGDWENFTDINMPSSHPLKELFKFVSQHKYIVRVTPNDRKAYEQY
ncbi:hypothetical protein IQ07DRAFT_578077 [Pyrenochaeta sp. DS3sAY3a]|nr:hypothetical protein IQ07DRAFT_578077 [Pyrenochaeta sp. DS3sAY3a]